MFALSPAPRRSTCTRWVHRLLLLVALTLVTLPAVAQQTVRLEQARTPLALDFPADRDWVEVPFRFDNNKIVVPIGVNGSEPLDFVLDTGSSLAVMLDAEVASGLEFAVLGQAQLGGAGSGGEMALADMAHGVRLQLGEVQVTGAVMAVLRGETSLGDHSWQGIVGKQILDSLVVEIDWQNQRLRLADPERYRAPKEARVLPLELDHGHVFVRGEVALPDGAVKPVRLVIDSGAYHALALDGRKLEALPEPRIDGAKLGRGLGGVIHGSIARVGELRLGGFTLPNVLTRFPEPKLADVITSGSDGNLGAEVLRRFVVTFDYSRKQLLLRPTEALDDPFRFSTAGFAIHPDLGDDGTAEVDDLYPDSPAVAAGLLEGDTIVRIDGQSPGDLGKDAVRALLEQDPGTTLTLDIRRGDEAKTLELTLERLL